jgi:hypothetical protein
MAISPGKLRSHHAQREGGMHHRTSGSPASDMSGASWCGWCAPPRRDTAHRFQLITRAHHFAGEDINDTATAKIKVRISFVSIPSQP